MVLHCRRLLGGNDQGYESYVKIKFLWISTIDIRTTISKRCFDLKLRDGEDVWWNESVAAFVVKETRKDVVWWDENRSDFGMWPENLKSYPSYSRDL
jgi:predicted molibdopterin-dependent oxidoreductase YjgC